MTTVTKNPVAIDHVAALSSPALTARAAKYVTRIVQSGISLRDREARAFEALAKSCAHLGDVEVLQAAAARATRYMMANPVIRYMR